MNFMWTAHTVSELRKQRRVLPGSVAFVPTMGALHAGHLSLVQAGFQRAGHVIVSIFVNPTQFGPREDFSQYPRPLERDLELCRQSGVTGVFIPSVEEMYPPTAVPCEVDVPTVAAELEGQFRPGHFRGVCRVVAKLFNQVQPDIACFGMKDYQQLQVIRAMTADLAFPIEIVPCPTLREPDGLAMSSRNVYLSASQRPQALALSQALQLARAMILQQGVTEPARIETMMRETLRAAAFEIDYAVVRHPQTLAPLSAIDLQATGCVVALIAARWPNVRLIDNLVISREESVGRGPWSQSHRAC